MDYIDSLRIFRSVVEARSFTRAADMHSLTTPVVSRAIARLEKRLGNRLFHRSTRAVSLTETAERFYEGCCRVLDDLDALEADATDQTREANGVLRLVAHTTATVNRLVPLIASFKRAHPKVTLDVILTERPVDLIADGYDLGLVLPFMLNNESTVTRLLERIPLALVTTPAYLAERGTPKHPADLVEHVFVPMPPSMRKPSIAFRADDEEIVIPMQHEVASNNPEFNREMVLQGFGIGILPTALVSEELAAGKLVTVLDDFPLVDMQIEIRLAYTTRTLLPAKVRAFIDHATAFFDDVRHDAPAKSKAE
ncbi:LysR family transcriptional regulator [Paraburkholderia unamae]|uniref:LysR family transcriptional regulator n=1 Tax=Paraburkholderia unamae TaxID=219649 RepID=A0ABX5KCW5_9BURK|nr:LysR family transcriptional regulator [Paraburkholderia unamae]PVX71088.1 LysR family transcriptional regulator [Paraburkholderia unamae]RAR48752.1 LysR family transcriptional regulator [Paraburkholderia unamae]CAG9246926.1 LysR family transcriptional regulator [Paraburkholderia unamae]